MRSSTFVAVAAIAAACAADQPTPASPAMPTANEQLVRRLYAEVINPNRMDALPDFVAADFVGPAGTGPASFAASIDTLRAGFPDLAYTLEDVVAGADRVAVRWTVRGTHTGPFRSFAPTGKTFANTGFAIFQITDGKIVHAWVQTDRLAFLQALGVIPDDPRFGAPPPPAQ
jgi:predicted ester cyclase